jgi:redox-sensitive bicupin YhaK (pirin superfamily)
MMTLRRAAERGHFDHGWLDTTHTFSFADYFDPRHMGFRALRVINEDRVKPGHGFGTHPHRDMEILSWVLSGALEHRDSMGTGSVIRPGELQRMSAGTGVLHSEKNASTTEPVHFLQIWLLPSKKGLVPGYAQRAFDPAAHPGRLLPVASPDGREGSLTVNADARVLAGQLGPEDSVVHRLEPGRHAWVHVARGAVRLNGQPLSAGDGAALSGEEAVRLEGAAGGGEVLLFDLG